MRISDWSSDVCSSDLAAARQGQSPSTTPAQGQGASPDTVGNQNGAATAALMAPRTLVAASAAQGEQPAGQAARRFGETLFGSLGSTLETGRASRRERVGQYVSTARIDAYCKKS